MLTAVIAFLAAVTRVLVDPLISGVGLPQQSGLVLCWLVAAGVNWFVGTRPNGRSGWELIDAQTGQRIMLRRRHTLFWIPMQYYSVLLLLLGLLAVFGAWTSGTRQYPAPTGLASSR